MSRVNLIVAGFGIRTMGRATSLSLLAPLVIGVASIVPPDEEKWRERRETMWLYSQPTSPPVERTVFGSTEVDKRARLVDAPAATYPDQARAAVLALRFSRSLDLSYTVFRDRQHHINESRR